MKVGVLALQGDVREHISSLIACGVDPSTVRRASELDQVDALVLPGGESTTIAQLAEVFGIYSQIKNRIAVGMPIYGSCAGMILLADEILDAKQGQKSFGGLDITVRRNAFGRQVDSFESDIPFADGSSDLIRAVFIRAPWVERVGEGVEVLATVDTHPVAVRSRTLFATSFHPELTADHRIHRYFIEEVARPALEKVK
ncbi:MAG: pyridoxal 5'-phosphate synthase glutaminase subunit PdxT [Actinobacteria bacterium]|uniref:glutaminase n=1 Tax=freshwater metagenome TaxID=449393 RepID=A0A6J6AWZ8_9ZZZZ|nr:pyridoxal 5'-phosphate synthase glutaminase subunit PdxT [Actinomycetota bacterium]